jgi:hypothetical protein
MKNLRALLHALTGIALGALWFSLYVTLWASGLGMLVTLLGIPIIWLTLYLTPYFAAVEVELARGLLGADAYVPPKISGWELRTRLALKANWHAQLYMLMRFIPGLLLQCVLIGLVVQGIALVVGPVWYWAPKDGIDLGIVQIDELWEAFLFIPVGFAAIAAGWWLAGPYGRYQRHLAEQLLHGETVEVGPRKLGLEIGGTFAVCAVLQTICLIVWLATGTTSNWVVFTGIGLATPVLLQAALKGGGGRAGPVRQHAMFGTVVVAV